MVHSVMRVRHAAGAHTHRSVTSSCTRCCTAIWINTDLRPALHCGHTFGIIIVLSITTLLTSAVTSMANSPGVDMRSSFKGVLSVSKADYKSIIV